MWIYSPRTTEDIIFDRNKSTPPVIHSQTRNLTIQEVSLPNIPDCDSLPPISPDFILFYLLEYWQKKERSVNSLQKRKGKGKEKKRKKKKRHSAMLNCGYMGSIPRIFDGFSKMAALLLLFLWVFSFFSFLINSKQSFTLFGLKK